MNECALSNLLTNTKTPSVTLFDTGGHAVVLDKLDGCTVIYTYPRINLPSVARPPVGMQFAVQRVASRSLAGFAIDLQNLDPQVLRHYLECRSRIVSIRKKWSRD